MTFKTVLQLIIFITLAQELQCQYPFQNTTQQVQISGTPGEVRGSGNRYHLGVDFAVAVNTNLYAINGGDYFNIDGCSVAVGEYVYIHMVKDMNFIQTYGSGVIPVPDSTLIGYTVTCQTSVPHLQDKLHAISIIKM